MHITDPSLRRIQRRQRIWAVLHDGRGRIGRVFHASLAFLIILSVALIPLEWMSGFDISPEIIHGIEAFIVGTFSLEYLLRIYSAPRRLRYIFSLWGLVDLLSIAPFYAGIFGTEYVRVLRVVRFLKLGEIEPSGLSDEGRSLERGIGLLPGEHIHHVATKHPLVLLVGCVPCVVAITAALGAFTYAEGNPIGIALGVMLMLFAGIFFWRTWLDYSYDVIYITNLRLVFQNQHLLGISTNQVGYSSVTNVKPQYAGVFSYLFRFGTLIIDTAAEHPGQIGMTMIRKHEKAAHAIMSQLHQHGQIVSADHVR